MAIDVRLVTDADVPEVLAHVAATLGEFGLEFGNGSVTDGELRALPGSYLARGGAFWVARAGDGALLGTCGVFPIAPPVFELRKMYLGAGARGTGLGKQLLDVATAWAKDAGANMLVLDTVEAMTRAIAFYEAHGFVRDDTQIRGARCTRGYAKSLR